MLYKAIALEINLESNHFIALESIHFTVTVEELATSWFIPGLHSPGTKGFSTHTKQNVTVTDLYA